MSICKIDDNSEIFKIGRKLNEQDLLGLETELDSIEKAFLTLFAHTKAQAKNKGDQGHSDWQERNKS